MLIRTKHSKTTEMQGGFPKFPCVFFAYDVYCIQQPDEERLPHANTFDGDE